MIFFGRGDHQHLVRHIDADRGIGHDRREGRHDRRRIGGLQRVGLGDQVAATTPLVRLVQHRLDAFVIVFRGGDDEHLVGGVAD